LNVLSLTVKQNPTPIVQVLSSWWPSLCMSLRWRQGRRSPRHPRLLCLLWLWLLLLLRRRIRAGLTLLLLLSIPRLTVLIRRLLLLLLLWIVPSARRSRRVRRLLAVRVLLVHRVLLLRGHTVLLRRRLLLGRGPLAISAWGRSGRRRTTVHPSLRVTRPGCRGSVPRLTIVLLRRRLRLGMHRLLRRHLLLLLLWRHLLGRHLLLLRWHLLLLGWHLLTLRTLPIRLPRIRLGHRILGNMPARIQRNPKRRRTRRTRACALLWPYRWEYPRLPPRRLLLLLLLLGLHIRAWMLLLL
jgi:hypothetical protein